MIYLKAGAGKKPESISDRAAKEVMAAGANEELLETMTNCLLDKGNEVIEELLQKMGRMVMRRASNVSSGLDEKETEVSKRLNNCKALIIDCRRKERKSLYSTNLLLQD